MVIVDYVDILMLTGNFKEKDMLQVTSEDLRGLNGELEIPIWTGFHKKNRSGLEEDVIGVDKVVKIIVR